MSVSRLSKVIPRVSRARAYATASGLKPNTSYLAETHPDTAPESTHDLIKEHSSYLLNTYARPPILFKQGKGLKLTDSAGREYLDFAAGIAVLALGHADDGVNKILAEQSGILSHASNVYWNEWAGELAKSLVEKTRDAGALGLSKTDGAPGAKVFFSNSGTEANEGALKFARKVGKDRGGETKTGIVCFSNGFHGRSFGALSVTTNPKYQAPFTPLVPDVHVGEYNNADKATIDALINESTCGVIVEPIQGEGGIGTASPEFLAAVAARAREVGAVLIYDEIQCGLYRTGDLWAHAALPQSSHPDIVTMAKPLANGFPIGAILVRDEVADAIGVGSHGTTFGGQPLATRLGHYVLGRLSEPEFKQHIKDVSAHLDGLVARLPKLFPNLIKDETRGRGLIRGIPFKNEAHPARVMTLLRQRGVLALTAGKDAVRLIPALTVSKEECDHAIGAIESVLTIIEKEQ
ncbi:Acetylornithine aminotransferase, mitochondrial [Vanrija pseudolonga]|uniref:Acetylornithine aminotransferase, mitochondrial n=1 Tax=Vanrija pseudolonga TaxID=143232 RepID=A0AAF0Y4L9_9TREE|nr:Acetylornithine aminotransferase, mitochondrial [Vanrija pseudolonga]